ncbi:G protein-coupled glucose receptor regulating Gpa2-domain-containing protein [Plectosphaerella cucumerina]|uniref:G protein-coupled glucose receptor regulating Gpa2-domain-containing protein n=1 Tax=Plectosphaerella cucumerina TaxID=40658 RepID=A0A8K0T8E7_9PEZI|nr:G protein-coupled glucose receptor regulating Gpa2-domain-containing protein [Plectosphaerella cucumerina]
MAPTSGGLALLLFGVVSLAAAADSEIINDPFIPTGLTGHQIHILRVSSLVFSVLTIVSSLLVLYWFAHMRRSFRHDLIMLLIVGDTIEALFFFIFPIVYLVHGPIDSQSNFCQVSGFFLAVGIESSDIAVALIAIHTALYIFKPNQGSGQSGLYPYRYWAYAAYTIIPLLLGGLAFINDPAYTNNGSYCYLPAEPRWSRFALSWVPRYVILLLIVVIYGFIYIYVTILMRRFGQQSDMQERSARPAGTGLHTNQTGSVPPTPPIAYHGLIPSSTDSQSVSYVDWDRQRHSISSIDSIGMDPHATYEAQGPDARRQRRASLARALRWKWPKSNSEAAVDIPPETLDNDAQQDSPHPESTRSPRGSIRHASITIPPPSVRADQVSRGPVVKRERPTQLAFRPQRALSVPQIQSPPGTDVQALPSHDFQSESGFWNRQVEVGDKGSSNTTSQSNPNMVAVLQRGPPRRKQRQQVTVPAGDPANPQANVSGSTGTSSSNFIPPHMSADPAGMGKARNKIRRQLRLLFIYPVIYVLVWVLPFIAHIFRWDDPNKAGPFGLVYASLVSLCIQGFADSVLFAMREKPWRHPRRASVSSTGTLFRRRHSSHANNNYDGWCPSFRPMLARCFGDKWAFSKSLGGGRTREEMLVDGRFARIRRVLETEEWTTRERGPRTEREWWEWLEDIGGPLDSDDDADIENLELNSPGTHSEPGTGEGSRSPMSPLYPRFGSI